MSLWLVRGGKFGQRDSLSLEQGMSCIGFDEVPDLSKTKDRDGIIEILRETNPDDKEARFRNRAAQLHAFVHRMKNGDHVALPLKSKPQIAIGKVTGPYKYRDELGESCHTRKVEWLKTDIPRTRFGQDLLYSLGAFMTVCQIQRNNAEERVGAILEGKPDPGGFVDEFGEEGAEVEAEPVTDVEQIALDQLLSHLEQRFKGHELSRLVEAILKAEGYETFLSPPGPDKGVDILAGGGTMGLDGAKLCVQVKSGQTPCDVTVFRSLIGTMQTFSAEQGLLVSWSGFNRAVEQEAKTHFFTVRLWDASQLLEALFRNYEKLPEALRNELPLKRIWALVPEEN